LAAKPFGRYFISTIAYVNSIFNILRNCIVYQTSILHIPFHLMLMAVLERRTIIIPLLTDEEMKPEGVKLPMVGEPTNNTKNQNQNHNENLLHIHNN
jgi:hypothetical protein